ncbi:glutamate formimidoyltransferase [Desulfoferrobacter suflitae]|uniref:glutamate formimidoyltransferase n=1 Tax=Desulfoferrobacter suflitae TaxID=2865782 RepID=UPI002164137C|nr:glutamate formimidoyltransferase [Desulfoferrobacter suflitae]MCK8602952.1 glutamate formimidoyltransferase [Desulfoferrobacter suflitae]
MTVTKKLIECVPNFSEGRDPDKIEPIVEPFRGKQGVKLLDYQCDQDHNRMVVTVAGEPEALRQAVVAAVGAAVEQIDMTGHEGQHPRMGAVDVVPFIPIRNVTMAETVEFSREVAREMAERFSLPIFLYEASAFIPARRNLAAIRKGQFEGMPEKLQQPQWKPDYGPDRIHPTAGVTAVGARMPLVAFNVNLATSNLEIARQIALKVRHISGGLRFCKAIGVELKDRGMVQVSMNMTDYTKTALYRALELVRIEARRYGVSVAGSEIIGLIPVEALIDCAVYYLGIENFSVNQVLEMRLME